MSNITINPSGVEMASSQAAIDSSERVDQASPGAPGQSLNVSSNTPPSSTTSASPPLGASGVSNAYGVPGAAAAGPTQSATTATAVIPTNQHRPPSVKRRVLDALTSQRLWTVVGGICALLSVYSLVKSEKSYALSKWTVRNDALQTCRDTPVSLTCILISYIPLTFHRKPNETHIAVSVSLKGSSQNLASAEHYNL